MLTLALLGDVAARAMVGLGNRCAGLGARLQVEGHRMQSAGQNLRAMAAALTRGSP